MNNALLKEINKCESFYNRVNGFLTDKLDQLLLQQLILIRLVSSLEVFMTAKVRNIFMYDKKPFLKFLSKNLDNREIKTLTQSEVLNSKNISNLHEKIFNKIQTELEWSGFKVICDFYKKYLDIDVSSFVSDTFKSDSFNYIEELHKKRHIIVHALGKDVKIFTNTKGQKKKKTKTICFTSDDFEKIFIIFKDFSEFIMEQVIAILYDENIIMNDYITAEYRFEIKSINDYSKKVMSDSFSFLTQTNDIIILSSILKYRKYIPTDDKWILRICGDGKILRSYRKILKKHEMQGNLVISDFKSF